MIIINFSPATCSSYYDNDNDELLFNDYSFNESTILINDLFTPATSRVSGLLLSL